jgi:hypothetical protein
MLGELGGEVWLLGDPQAIGVDHHMADWLGAGERQDFEELRVQRRLAAGELNEVGLTLAGDDRIEHFVDRRQGQMLGALRR